MEDTLGVRPELIEGDDGVFDVAVDGDVVFSKQVSGAFIATTEVVALVRDRAER